MSSHVGVKCDACQKGNFKGKRYKCLACYDYDLCTACYDAAVITSTHLANHPMQCILTAGDYELYYGGESVISVEHPYSYTCPYCSRVGFTLVSLEEHVVAEHSNPGLPEIICPICAAHPSGEPNFSTADFIGHLTLEHNPEFRDLISFMDEPAQVSRTGNSQRAIVPTATPASATRRGNFNSSRARRSNMNFTTVSNVQRDTVDPIAELLTQLSSTRRSTTNTAAMGGYQYLGNVDQLRQLQLERDRYHAMRQQMDHRYSRPRKPPNNSTSVRHDYTNIAVLQSEFLLNAAGSSAPSPVSTSSVTKPVRKFLLDEELKKAEKTHNKTIDSDIHQSRSEFLKQLLLSSLRKSSKEPDAALKSSCDVLEMIRIESDQNKSEIGACVATTLDSKAVAGATDCAKTDNVLNANRSPGRGRARLNQKLEKNHVSKQLNSA